MASGPHDLLWQMRRNDEICVICNFLTSAGPFAHVSKKHKDTIQVSNPVDCTLHPSTHRLVCPNFPLMSSINATTMNPADRSDLSSPHKHLIWGKAGDIPAHLGDAPAPLHPHGAHLRSADSAQYKGMYAYATDQGLHAPSR